MNMMFEGEYPDKMQWEEVDEKVWAKVLWLDQRTGSHVRLLRADPGSIDKETLKHDFDELVYVLHGQQTSIKTGKVWRPGTVSFFPAGTEHGPFSTQEGITCLEFRYYADE